MNFQSITYVITVARERSITKAAKTLHVTQQTLSAHIASLEKELGCQLFIRHVPLELTYAGKQFLLHATSIQHEIKELYITFSEISGKEKGLLRVGITDNRDRVVLTPIVCSFLQKCPKVELEVVEVPVDVLTQKLFNDELDICISDFNAIYKGISYCDLYKERIVFVCEKKLFDNIYGDKAQFVINEIEQNQSFHLLEKCPLLLGHEKDIAGRFSRQVLMQFNKAPVIKIKAENLAFILDLCAHGIGGCFSPEILVRTALSPKQLDNLYIISLGSQANYTMRIGWKNNWKILDEFINTAKEQTRLHLS